MKYQGSIDQQLLKMCIDQLLQGGYIFTVESDSKRTTIRLNAGVVMIFDQPAIEEKDDH